MKCLAYLTLTTLLTFSSASAEVVTRFGLRCDGPFNNEVGLNYQPAGTDSTFIAMESLGNGDVVVEFKPPVDPHTLSAVTEGTRKSLKVTNPSINEATLSIGPCQINTVVVVLLKGTPPIASK
jgi:hypothetical protein